MKKVTVSVDSFRCRWCEACVEMCPDIFYYDEASGQAAAHPGEVELTNDLQTTATMCPSRCIELEEVES
ncbi:MAG: ferredoxin [Thermodesulfobacteriota bacterium]